MLIAQQERGRHLRIRSSSRVAARHRCAQKPRSRSPCQAGFDICVTDDIQPLVAALRDLAEVRNFSRDSMTCTSWMPTASQLRSTAPPLWGSRRSSSTTTPISALRLTASDAAVAHRPASGPARQRRPRAEPWPAGDPRHRDLRVATRYSGSAAAAPGPPWRVPRVHQVKPIVEVGRVTEAPEALVDLFLGQRAPAAGLKSSQQKLAMVLRRSSPAAPPRRRSNRPQRRDRGSP